MRRSVRQLSPAQDREAVRLGEKNKSAPGCSSVVERAVWDGEAGGSTPLIPTTFPRLWSNWIRHRPSKPNDGGSIPSGRTKVRTGAPRKCVGRPPRWL
jgi:hypothetical protein